MVKKTERTYRVIPKEILGGLYAQREYRLYSTGVFKNHSTGRVIKPTNHRGRPRFLGYCPLLLQYRLANYDARLERDNGTNDIRGVQGSDVGGGVSTEPSSIRETGSSVGSNDGVTTTNTTTDLGRPTETGSSGDSSSESESTAVHIYPLDGDWWNWSPTNIGVTSDNTEFLRILSTCTRRRKGDNHRVTTRVFTRYSESVQRRVVDMRLSGHTLREIILETGIGYRTLYHIFRDHNAKVIKEREESNEPSE
jgi:hypothetical protein